MPYTKLYYHLIWSTKHREPLIHESFERRLYGVIRHKSEALGSYVLAVNGIADHVHVVVSIPPKLALASYVQHIKGSSSWFVNHKMKPAKKLFWQGDYGAYTIGERHLAPVIRYVENQKQHHQVASTIVALEKC